MQLEPGTVIDRYTVEGFLGEGGMALVYKVRHNELKTVHALKLLSVSSPSIKQRLVREGRVQAQLKHPNIVTVTDIVDEDGKYGLVMDLVRGPSLHQLLAYNRLTLEQADTIAYGLLSGMRAAHEAGLIHRDLKPANVLLETQAGRMEPRIADFGLAKIATGGLRSTRSGVALGTPSYMAPEQVRSAKDVDLRADIFALGVIFYELYTGEQTFPGGDMLEIFKRVTAGEFTPATDLVPDLPPRIVRALTGALQVAPEDRFSTVGELMSVLFEDAPTQLTDTTWDPGLLESVREISEEIPSLRPDRTLPPAERRQAVPRRLDPRVWGALAVGMLLGLLVLWAVWPGEAETPVSKPVAEVVAPAPVVEQAPAPVPVRPVAPAPKETRVVVEGDVPVELVGGGDIHRPGVVPPGAYELRALLEGRPMILGQVVAIEGETVTLRCSAAMMVCRSDVEAVAGEAVENVWGDPGIEPEPQGGEAGGQPSGSPWEDPAMEPTSP